jgi:hypothetical protein
MFVVNVYFESVCKLALVSMWERSFDVFDMYFTRFYS